MTKIKLSLANETRDSNAINKLFKENPLATKMLKGCFNQIHDEKDGAEKLSSLYMRL